jgi:hypothetical protein
MNIPFTIAFSTTQATAFFFIENAAKSTLVRNVIIHNEHTGNQVVHLCYKAGYADTIGLGTSYDFYAATIPSKTSAIFNDLIICNPGDSIGIYGEGQLFNCVANCVVL